MYHYSNLPKNGEGNQKAKTSIWCGLMTDIQGMCGCINTDKANSERGVYPTPIPFL